MSDIKISHETDVKNVHAGVDEVSGWWTHNENHEDSLVEKARIYADNEKQRYPRSTYLEISNDGIKNSFGNEALQYKGSKINYREDITGYYQVLSKKIQESVCNLFKNEMISIEILNIKVNTASNEPGLFEKVTFVKPVEKDMVSNCCGHDKYVWYDVYAMLNGKIINTTPLCFGSYEPTNSSAGKAASSVVRFANPESIAVALQFTYKKQLAKRR